MNEFYARFCEEQWKFCAPELCDTTSGVQFEEQSVLPFIGLKYAGGGSSSVVYQATVHAQHDKLVCHGEQSFTYTFTDFFHVQEIGSVES
jgi:hypothetical protein